MHNAAMKNPLRPAAPHGGRLGHLGLVLGSILAGLLCTAAPCHAGPRDFAVYLTRLGGDPDAAQPYISKFLAYLEVQVGWPKGSSKGAFLSSKKEAQAYLTSTKPGFALLEPALYLEMRKSDDLEPLAQVTSKDLWSEHLHLLVKDPALRSLNDVKGKRLWSMLADSPVYLSKIVFSGKVDAKAHFVLKQIGQSMKGVRAVLRGEADATLVDDEQMEAAKKMEGGAALHSVYDSGSLPPLPVVAFGKNIKPEDRKKLAKVLLEMCGTAKGGEVCNEMHIGKFAPLTKSAFVEAQKDYEQP